MQGFMLTYFTQQLPPARPVLVTFLTSNFSHAGLAHLGLNMLALSSFGGIVAEVGLAAICPHIKSLM